jgi:predicted glutamine amidotransferase
MESFFAPPGQEYDSHGGYYFMSADEMREQKVRLTIELEDAQKQLSALREKATARADKVIQFGAWLKTQPELYIYRQGHSEHHGQPVDQIRFLSDNDIEALQLIPALEIANSIRREIAKVANLEKRLSTL